MSDKDSEECSTSDSDSENYYSDKGSSSETSSTDHEEYIRTHKYVTKSGRVSRPVLKDTKGESSKLKHKQRKQKQKTSKMGDPQPVIQLTQQQFADLVGNRHSTTQVMSTNELPKYRGRRRLVDPAFEETVSFATHMESLKRYIAMLPDDATDEHKKDLLVRSADKKVGDFNALVTKLCNETAGDRSTFDQIVNILHNNYCDKSNKSRRTKNIDIKMSNIIENENTLAQLIDLYTKVEGVVTDYMEDQKTALRDHFDESFYTNVASEDLRNKFWRALKDALTHIMAESHVGTLLNDELNKKVFGNKVQRSRDLLDKLTNEIKDNPPEKRILTKKSTGTYLVDTDYQEEQFNDEEQETDVIDEECYYVNNTSSRGFNNVRGKKSSGRMRGRSRGRGTSMARGSPRSGYIGDRAGALECQYVRSQEVNKSKSGNSNPSSNKTNPNAMQDGLVKCFRCNKIGHYSSNCRSAAKKYPCQRCGKNGHHASRCEAKIEEVRFYHDKNHS